MGEVYFMNSEQEKFETTEKRCVYCKKNDSVGNESIYFQELFLESKRIDLIVYNYPPINLSYLKNQKKCRNFRF
jgi:hypothetical protein